MLSSRYLTEYDGIGQGTDEIADSVSLNWILYGYLQL